MSVVEWKDVTVAAAPAVGPTDLDDAPPRHRELAFWARLVLAAGLATLAHASVFLAVVTDAAAGSHRGYLVTLPVLLVLIASGYRARPRGVGDDETDWILSLLFCGAALAGIHLVSDRMPTLAGLWRVEMLGVVVWFAGLIALLFGVRHAARMWPLWLFAAVVATPLPYLLGSAMLGGSDTAATLMASAVGAGAVALAGRCSPWRPRAAATAGCLVVSAASGAAVVSHAGVLIASVVAAAVVPALTTMILTTVARQTWSPSAAQTPAAMPRRSLRSLLLLTAAAVASTLLQPASGVEPAEPTATPGWLERSTLRPVASYPFITRYLGSSSRLERYSVPATGTEPAAAVDVITTQDAAVLADFADVVWYPSSQPVDYRPAPPSTGLPDGTRLAHTDADSVTTRTETPWYAVTWNWSVGALHQQVTVIVDQASSDMPPEPAAPSFLDVVVRPALWLARQQPGSSGDVAEAVVRRAEDIVASVDAAAHPGGGGSTGGAGDA